MINSDTPYKLAEIIRNTWPNLYRPHKDYVPPAELSRGVDSEPNHQYNSHITN